MGSIGMVFSQLRKLFFPIFCVQCRCFCDDPVCKNCIETLQLSATKTIEITKKYSVKIYSLGRYQGFVRSLVQAKYYRQQSASILLGDLLWEKSDLRYADFDIIVPVPLHWTRYAWRWFNQSKLIARQLSIHSGKPVVELLNRVKKTSYQAGKTKNERLHNLTGAFTLSSDAKQYKNKTILLVDDVLTTGTTITEMARAILPLRPYKIIVAVAARA